MKISRVVENCVLVCVCVLAHVNVLHVMEVENEGGNVTFMHSIRIDQIHTQHLNAGPILY